MGDCLLCETELHGDDAGRYLCGPCQDATSGRLQAIPMLYADLAQFLRPGSPAPGPRAFRGGAGACLPVSEPVLGLRGPGGIVALLESWQSALHDDRGFGPPPVHGTIENRVKRAAAALRNNMQWIGAAWPVAGAFAEEIRDAHRDALSIVAPPNRAERGTRLGNCPALVNGVLCGAALRAYPGQTEITCKWCGCSWGPDRWLSLRSWIEHDEQEAKAS